MDRIIDLTFYNPAQLDDDSFLRGFVARAEVANSILARLGQIGPTGLARHRLIIGQRGMGKTSLLRRVAIGVKNDPKLSAVLLPLSFREEQYNIHNLRIFWGNCLDALGDWMEGSGQHDLASQLDGEVVGLGKDSDPEGEAALGLFKGWAKRLGRRPLLLLDNIDLVLGGLKDQQWILRRVLQEAGGMVVVGASAAHLEAVVSHDQAFYEFFQVDLLERLTAEELASCLYLIARGRGEPGKRVTEVLDGSPECIKVLADLTGGNPRTLAMMYLVLEAPISVNVMAYLEKLLDQATPLYKARVEELAPQARVVFDALALEWNPATAATLALKAGLEVGVVSAQLDRLVKAGIAEKATLSSTNRAGYQVAERFFNIWYLMRHASRRQRNRLRWLTEFLRGFYSARQMSDIATGLLHEPGGQRGQEQSFMGLAVAEAQRPFKVIDGDLPACATSVLAASRAISAGDTERATEELEAAFAQDDPRLFSDFFDDLLRVLRLADQRGFGEELLRRLDEAGLAERHWPLREAFNAYLHGEEVLRDVNPEVRGAATRILRWLNSNKDAQTSRPGGRAGKRSKGKVK